MPDLEEKSGRMIQFTDASQHELFQLPNGENLSLKMPDGDVMVRPCVYVDERHFAMGSEVYDTADFAEKMEGIGWIYRPEHPAQGDCRDTYEVHQLKTVSKLYAFMPWVYAADKMRPEHYRKVFEGVLARETTLEDILAKHSREDRVFGQQPRPMAMSDVIVLNRNGGRQAFYVDRVGFAECEEFLNPPRKVPRRATGGKKKNPER